MVYYVDKHNSLTAQIQKQHFLLLQTTITNQDSKRDLFQTVDNKPGHCTWGATQNEIHPQQHQDHRKTQVSYTPHTSS